MAESQTGGLVESTQGSPKQARSSWLAFAFIAAGSAVLIGAVLFMHQRWSVPMGTLTQDPLFHRPVYVGFLSQSGILLWAAAAAVCLTVAATLHAYGGGRAERRFFVSAGLLTVFLCLDDAFMLHDVVLPDHLGIPEQAVYAAYVGLVLAFLGVFFGRILESEYLVLGVAFVFFAVSILADIRELPWLDPFLLEDGAKAIGIVAWLTYFSRAGVRAAGMVARGEATGTPSVG